MIILTLTKNSSKTINDTIYSIENQSLKNIKWIIFDDNSNDDTLDKINYSSIDKEIIKIVDGKPEDLTDEEKKEIQYIKTTNDKKILDAVKILNAKFGVS